MVAYLFGDRRGDRSDCEAHVIDPRFEAALAIFAKWIIEAAEADLAEADSQPRASLTSSPDSPFAVPGACGEQAPGQREVV
ncbi:MAG: hypothetical protein MUO64_14740 [Anaerolineales bacterium]|nr:hypothetical protein [Anaerolineales bacterium]